MIFLPKHQYYGSLKNWPNHLYNRSQKIEKSLKKKVVRNFLTNLKIFIFFDFFSENVLKTLLRGHEATSKKYRIISEKYTFFHKKSKKSLKKSCSKCFEKIIFFYFFPVFLRNVSKTLLKGRETTRKKYRIYWEIPFFW